MSRKAKWVYHTTPCSGCHEAGDFGGNSGGYSYDQKAHCYIGSGCKECGYTGKRRHKYSLEELEKFGAEEAQHG